ncbi:MAG: calcium-binding protein [Myxococcaceae bacterium]
MKVRANPGSRKSAVSNAKLPARKSNASARKKKTLSTAPRKQSAVSKKLQQDSFQSTGGKNPGRVIHSNARVIHGTPGDDIIYGGNASQKIVGGGGNDIIIGGAGGDRIIGGKGNDTIKGGAGGDTIRGGKGRDKIAGGRGNDKLSGGDDADRIAGEIGDDHIYGGKGNDHATGGMGIDVLHGQAGNDVLSGDAGPDFVDGGKGKNDTVSFESQSGTGFDPKNPNSGVRVEGDKPSNWRSTYEGVHYTGSAYGGDRAAGGGGVDGLRGVENVVGSSKDDVIHGNFNTVEGGAGKDVATGNIKHRSSANGEPGKKVTTTGAVVDVSRSALTGGTTITVTGGKRNDDITVTRKGNIVTITSSKGVQARGGGRVDGKSVHIRVDGPIDALQIEGGKGNDHLKVRGFGTDVPITLSGGAGNDRLVGGKGNDTLNDGAGNDVLIGGGGDDGLTNSKGRDRLHGGKGNDLLVSSSIDRGDLLDGGDDADNVSFAQAGHDFAVRAKIGGTAQRIDEHGKAYGPRAHVTRAAEDLEGTERDDVLIGDSKDNKLLGRGGADTLKGLGGNDRLDAQYGDKDRLLDGGAGRDRATLDPEDRSAVRHVETTLKHARKTKG